MNLSDSKSIGKALRIIEKQRNDAARNHLLGFARYTMPNFQATWFHKVYYKILNDFAHGKIKKLIISVPPQHGKSEGSSIRLPAFMIGRNPDLKIATVCYSATKARKFGRKTKQVMAEKTFKDVFDCRLASAGDGNYINTAEEMEIVGHDGFLKCVGYEGGLTGDPVDVLLMDDLYKDYKEANSSVVRENVWDWYVTVADTRLHNDSQQLIVFTRWHEDDLIGHIEKTEEVKMYQDIEDLESYKGWVKINFEAIKTTDPNTIDPRAKNEPLWPDRHSLDKLLASKQKDNIKFDSLYQGNPTSKAGLLYGNKFKTYIDNPEKIYRKSYCDTADTGSDPLLNVVYDVCRDGLAYVVDIYFTDKPMEVTEPHMAGQLLKYRVNYADIESNNGGRGFARKIKEICRSNVFVDWFFQSNNKESRIMSNAATVLQKIVFPDDWHVRWPDFYDHLTKYKRNFKANKHDEGPDVLTGIVERMNIIPGGGDLLEDDYDDL